MRRPVGNAAGVALALWLAGAGFACHAEVRPGETLGLGLRGAQVPELLKAVAADPYRAPAGPACETIPAEIKALNEVLGAEAGQPRKERSLVVKWVSGSVRGMIPYRGVVRFLTQADHHDHELMEATMAGFARRGFLRGLEASLHCAHPGSDGPIPALDVPPSDTPRPTVATAAAASIPAAYRSAAPAAAPARKDLVTLMLTRAPAAPGPEASDDAAADPGR
ncbi:MAG TPA: hypothetical protein VIE16_01335 [Phenylobacterium sp.]|jgi:hypothetical protein